MGIRWENELREHRTTGFKGTEYVLPHDVEAERAVLGTALYAGTIPPAARVLSPSDFFSLGHARTWEVMLQLAGRGEAIDIITINNALAGTDGSPVSSRIAAVLGRCLDAGWSSKNVGYYVQIVRDKAVQRALIETAWRIAERAQDNGTSGEAALSAAQEDLKKLAEHASGPHQCRFAFRRWDLSVAGLEAQARVEWLVEPLIAPPDVVTLVGDGGVGKSKLAASVALSVAFGKPLWGQFEVRRTGKVVYVNEERPDLTLRHLHTLAPSLGIEPSEIDQRIDLVGRGPKPWRVTDKSACEGLVLRVQQLGGVALIIWDSLHVLHEADENDNAQMSRVIEGFRAICLEAQTCGLILHHTGKSEFGEGGLSARGASAIKDTVDAQFLVRRVKKEAPGELQLNQDKTRRALVPPFQLRLEHDPEGEITAVIWAGKAPTKTEEAVTAVLEILRSSASPLKSGEIAQALVGRFRNETVYQALTRVRKENLAAWREGEHQGFVYGCQDEKASG